MGSLLARAALAAGSCLLTGAAPASASTAPMVRLAGTGVPATFVPSLGPTDAVSATFGSADQLLWNGSVLRFTDPVDHRVLQIAGDKLSLWAGSGQGGATSTPPVALTSATLPMVRAIANGGFGGGYYLSTFGTDNPHLVQVTGDTTVSNSYALGTSSESVWSASSVMGPPVYLTQPTKSAVSSFTGGTSTVVAGNGTADANPPTSSTVATSVGMGSPYDISVDRANGTSYIASTSNGYVWRHTHPEDPDNDQLDMLAGLGSSLGDDGPAIDADLINPFGVVLLSDGGWLVYDSGHRRVRRVEAGDAATAKIKTVVGNGADGLAAPGTPANIAPLGPYGDIEVTPDGLVISQGTMGVVEMVPAAAITSGPPSLTNSRSATFTLASWDDGALFECKLDDASHYSPCGDQTGVADGEHVLTVIGTTAAVSGSPRASNPVTYKWTVDATPPSAPELVDGPGDSFSWKASSDALSGVDHYELNIDGKLVTKESACDGGTCSAKPPEIGDGTHTWFVKVFDKAGNGVASASRQVVRAVAPLAALAAAPNRVLAGRAVTFDASASTDPNGAITRFEWDLDGDGSFDTDTGSAATTTRSYDKPQSLTAQVRVTDSGGLTAVATAPLVVTALAPPGKPLGVSINDGAQYTNDPSVTVFAVWPSFASNALVSNDGGFKSGVSFAVAETIPWKLDSSGPERLPKTIYVRFVGGSQTSETYQDDIILDQTPPKVTEAQLSGAQPKPAGASKVKTVTLRLKAKDNVSGVGAAQVTKNKKKPGKLLKYKKTLKVAPAKKLYVRVRDRAGNFSAWRTAKRR
jgi:hypothetical protein